MSDDLLDRRITSARSDLRGGINPEPPSFDWVARRRANRHRVVAATGALLLVAATAVAVVSRTDDSGSNIVAGPSETGTNEDLLAPGESRRTSTSPLAGRSTMASVWTGSEMLIWGGDGPSGQFDDGAAYEPRTDTWELLPDAPLSPRNAPAAVWTGDELLLWGGSASGGDFSDGAAYDPATKTWRTIAAAPFSSAGRPVGLWTGSEMVVLAGFNSSDAAAYDPASDEWRVLPDTPRNLQAPNPVAVWTGDAVVAVVQPRDPMGSASAVVSMRLGADQWTEAPPAGGGQILLGWTGEAVVAASGDEARLFDLVSNEWRTIASAPSDTTVGDTAAVWTGSHLFVWEGDRASLIDPKGETWQLTPSGDPGRRTQSAVVWADGVLIAWGGFPDEASGVVVRPRADGADAPDTSGPVTTDSEALDLAGEVGPNGGIVVSGGVELQSTPESLYPDQTQGGTAVGPVAGLPAGLTVIREGDRLCVGLHGLPIGGNELAESCDIRAYKTHDDVEQTSWVYVSDVVLDGSSVTVVWGMTYLDAAWVDFGPGTRPQQPETHFPYWMHRFFALEAPANPGELRLLDDDGRVLTALTPVRLE